MKDTKDIKEMGVYCHYVMNTLAEVFYHFSIEFLSILTNFSKKWLKEAEARGDTEE